MIPASSGQFQPCVFAQFSAIGLAIQVFLLWWMWSEACLYGEFECTRRLFNAQSKMAAARSQLCGVKSSHASAARRLSQYVVNESAFLKIVFLVCNLFELEE